MTDILAIMIKRDGEQFVFAYRPGQGRQVIQAACRWADDPSLNFGWRDAAIVRSKLPPDERTTRQNTSGSA